VSHAPTGPHRGDSGGRRSTSSISRSSGGRGERSALGGYPSSRPTWPSLRSAQRSPERFHRADGQAGSWAHRPAGLLLVGFFAPLSVGLRLVPAGLLAIFVLVRLVGKSERSRVVAASSIAGGIVAVVGVLVGFAVTERIIACPPGAVSSGGSGGLLAGSYSYICLGGRTIVTWGH
jgi:hypothetical protein